MRFSMSKMRKHDARMPPRILRCSKVTTGCKVSVYNRTHEQPKLRATKYISMHETQEKVAAVERRIIKPQSGAYLHATLDT
jgi:hypothetical protein